MAGPTVGFPLWSFIMKWLPLILVGIVTSVVDPAHSRGQQPVEPGKEKLNGDWFMISGDCHGHVATIFGQVPEPERTRILTFSDSAMKLTIDGESVTGSYHLDSTKVPKAVDLTFPLGAGKATTRGIYELKGDQLRMCLADFGAARPTGFPPKDRDPVGRVTVITFRRIGADPKLDALDRNKALCARNLLALAEIMHDHVADRRHYPPAAIHSKDGKPLLSWRVALLEHLDARLLKEFKTDEPWDSIHNRKLIKKMPKLYALPGVETREPGMTFFQVFTGKGTIFEGKEGLKLSDHVGSGDSHIMIVEAGEPIPWTRPDDLAYDPKKPLPKLGRLSDEGFFAAFTFLAADRVLFVPRTTSEKQLRSMIQWRMAEQEKKP